MHRLILISILMAVISFLMQECTANRIDKEMHKVYNELPHYRPE